MGLATRLQRAEFRLYTAGDVGPDELDAEAVLRLFGIEPAAWQRRVLASTARRQLLAITRQGGKSTASAAKATHRTVFKPGALVIIVSPTQRQSSEVLRKCMQLYQALGRPIPFASETKMSIELANGSRILSLPGSEATIRGYSAPDLIIVDEAAKVEDQLLFAVLPMMAANPDTQLISMSTPFGRRGWFSDAWHDGGADWERHLVTAYEVEHINDEELETFRRLMPDWWFRSEFLCQFLETEDALFRESDIVAAFSEVVTPLNIVPLALQRGAVAHV